MFQPGEEGQAVFTGVLQDLVSRHPKFRAIKTGLVAQYLSSVIFGRSEEEACALLRQVNQSHVKACLTDQWTKERGRYSESLHGWLARRGWEDVLPEAKDDDLEEMRTAAARYMQEKRVR